MRPVLGLPGRVRACLFDLDGVLTQTAAVHAATSKEMFDHYCREVLVAAGIADLFEGRINGVVAELERLRDLSELIAA